MRETSWVLRSLAVTGTGDIRATTAQGDNPFDALAEIFARVGYSTAERALSPKHVKYLPPRSVVELRTRELGVVRRASEAVLELEVEHGQLELRSDAIGAQLTGRVLVHYAGADGSLLRTLGRIAFGDPVLARSLRQALAFSFLARVFALALPLLTHWALVRAMPNAELATLSTLGIALACFGGFVGGVQYLRAKALLFVELHVSERFSRDLFVRMLARPFDVVTARPPGEAWQSFIAADQWIKLTLPQLVAAVDGLTGALFLLVLARFEPRSAVTCMVAALVSLLWVVLLAARQGPAHRAAFDAKRARQTTLLRCLDAIEVVRAERLEKRFERRLAENLREELVPELTLATNRAKIEAVTQAFGRGLFVIVYGMLGLRCLEGQAEVADLITALQLVAGFEIGFREVLAAPQRFVALRALRWRLDETLAELGKEQVSKSDPPTVCASAGDLAVSLRNVFFRHAGGGWILQNLNLDVRRGERVTLSWPSGSGKTTLLRLIAGLHTPTQGTVAVDGEAPGASRDRICYVPQGTPLLSASVMDNLAVLSGGASRERIVNAARASGLEELVESWPMQWDTILSGGGRTISSGQAQLVLLTAAMASAAPIVLLDEALAHLDAETKRRFLSSRPFNGRTVISVEHEPRNRARS